MASIMRLYESYDTATAVRRELRANGFTDDQVTVVRGAGGSVPAQSGRDDQFMAELTAAGLGGSDATTYAECLRQGAVFISVNAPLGRGAQATTIMDAHTPPDTGHARSKPESDSMNSLGLIDEPAPLSKLLHIPVLVKDSSEC